MRALNYTVFVVTSFILLPPISAFSLIGQKGLGVSKIFNLLKGMAHHS